MISLLVTIIVFCIIAGLVYYLLQILPLAQPFKNIVMVCFVVICILVLLGWLFGGVELPRLRSFN